MVKKSTVAIIMTIVILAIGGCAEKKLSDEKKAEITVSKLSGLLNGTEEDASTLLGDGKENCTDKGVLLGKAYVSKLYEKDANIHTLYSESGTINMVQAELPSWKDADCAKIISKETGVSMTKTDKGESGQNYGQWNFDKKIINMLKYDDTVTLEIFIPEE